jgi:hypothetical protein
MFQVKKRLQPQSCKNEAEARKKVIPGDWVCAQTL